VGKVSIVYLQHFVEWFYKGESMDDYSSKLWERGCSILINLEKRKLFMKVNNGNEAMDVLIAVCQFASENNPDNSFAMAKICEAIIAQLESS
jgi:hypothetical protein